MAYSFSLGSPDGLISSWAGLPDSLKTGGIFTLPGWYSAWYQAFGVKTSPLLGLVEEDNAVIGIAPLKLEEDTASFICEDRLCDYMDFIVSPGREDDFFNVLLDELKKRGVRHLELKALRPDSTVLTSLTGVARQRQDRVACQKYDVSLELILPETWDAYLAALSAKQRHEVERKTRRLQESGVANFRVFHNSQDIMARMDTFITLFRQSRRDKAQFMTHQMETFFKLLARNMSREGLLRLGFLEIDSLPVAAVAYFDYNNTTYLYNSGYDPSYRWLSVGLLSKVLCIKDSIERKKSKFDFLRGAEVYKYRLGGTEVPLYWCHITLG